MVTCEVSAMAFYRAQDEAVDESETNPASQSCKQARSLFRMIQNWSASVANQILAQISLRLNFVFRVTLSKREHE